MGKLYLAIAIISEAVGTSALKASNGFTNFLPSMIVIIGYGLSFYMLSLTLKTINIGIAYALWAGLGIVLVALISAFWYKQIPDLPAILGMSLILIGVVIINVYSKMSAH
jgi:small multidrug resistance pump